MIKTETLVSEIVSLIQEEKIYTITDIFAFYTRISRATFYNRKLDKVDEIKKALDDNKTKTKKRLFEKWIESDNATLQLAAYKLIGTDEERKKLSQSYHDHTTGGEQIKPLQPISDEKLDRLIDKL